MVYNLLYAYKMSKNITKHIIDLKNISVARVIHEHLMLLIISQCFTNYTFPKYLMKPIVYSLTHTR